MLARMVPTGAGEGKSRLPERHQPPSIASTAAPPTHGPLARRKDVSRESRHGTHECVRYRLRKTGSVTPRALNEEPASLSQPGQSMCRASE